VAGPRLRLLGIIWRASVLQGPRSLYNDREPHLLMKASGSTYRFSVRGRFPLCFRYIYQQWLLYKTFILDGLYACCADKLQVLDHISLVSPPVSHSLCTSNIIDRPNSKSAYRPWLWESMCALFSIAVSSSLVPCSAARYNVLQDSFEPSKSRCAGIMISLKRLLSLCTSKTVSSMDEITLRTSEVTYLALSLM
jgi:hypothetical protein